MSAPNDDEKRAEALQTLFDQGIEIRRQVTGAAHVDRSWQNVPDFSRPMQEFATQAGWAMIWGRPGLDRRTRSLLNLAMLLALGKSTELGVHIRGAVANGCTETEIQETLLQAAGYAGFPAGMEGFRVAQRVLDEMKAEAKQ
jgi:4-carboxymuconolactone decarboxylase